MDHAIKEILRFSVGGGSAVIVDAVFYAFMKQRIGLHLSKAMSYMAGAAVGFAINKLWTFNSKRFKVMEVLKYITLYIFSACANTIVNKALLHLAINTVFAFLCATATSTIINFLGQKFIVFKKDKQQI